MGGLVSARHFSASDAQRVQKIWPDGKVPGSKGTSSDDDPELYVFLPACSTAGGCGVVVIPGGGYSGVCMEWEGFDPATWLVEKGLAAFVLRYRVGPTYKHPSMLHDGQRALRWVRQNASALNLDKSRIGVWGFSAGGHLASLMATKSETPGPLGDETDSESSRPDFCILTYPIITMADPFTHERSRGFLFGNSDTSEASATPQRLIEELSSDKWVNRSTPPSFVVHGRPDNIVPCQNSELFYVACMNNNVPCELHLYDSGGHGFAMAGNQPYMSDVRYWTLQLEAWLKEK
eukprot:TRINITY_DN28333_c0_g1_i1.p1 TRINITY_DN28333_c0_g1~~TRINITY_DN28333_c0_g1_i1.p1  ORF type:complete len:291 (-),score=44.67 TRINITY_DN28333_c0_g1_i1:19-891(-)